MAVSAYVVDDDGLQLDSLTATDWSASGNTVHCHYSQMEPVWGLERNENTGFQCWSRLDRSPLQKSVRFRCDVEVREYLTAKETPENQAWATPKTWTREPYRIPRTGDKDSGALLLAASLAVIAFTLTYKWWLLVI